VFPTRVVFFGEEEKHDNNPELFEISPRASNNAMTLRRLSLTAAFCACNLALSVEKAYADSDASTSNAAEDMTHDSGEAYDDDAFDLARLRIDHEYKSEV
jgi:hypothetical protein